MLPESRGDSKENSGTEGTKGRGMVTRGQGSGPPSPPMARGASKLDKFLCKISDSLPEIPV